MLGAWARDEAALDRLRDSFINAQPYPHVVIEGFFSQDLAGQLESKFPAPTGTSPSDWIAQGWHVYDNPIEGKLAKNDVRGMTDGDYRSAWELLQSEEVLALARRITGNAALETDPHLHGAGLHYHPSGSRLEMHLDYSIHPISGKERRVNLIVYLNSGWAEDWGGHLQLWSSAGGDMDQCVRRVAPGFNRAVLMQTSDISWHGLPDPVSCPEGTGRKSIAIYYVAEPRPDATPRHKASFRPAAADAPPGYLELCKIRDTRLITPQDVAEHMPEWRRRWA